VGGGDGGGGVGGGGDGGEASTVTTAVTSWVITAGATLVTPPENPSVATAALIFSSEIVAVDALVTSEASPVTSILTAAITLPGVTVIVMKHVDMGQP
jgi:hypothetical protein